MQFAPEPSEERNRDLEFENLIRLVAGGDQLALATLYDMTSRLIYGLVLRVLGDGASAEEVLLDVYVQVWRQAANFDNRRGSPLAWLTTIARSRAIDRLRSGRQDQQRKEPLEKIANSTIPNSSPEDMTVSSERQRMVRSALDSLSPEQREVIELAYFSGLSQSEIALNLSLPLGTVKTRTRLGMIKLKEYLAPVMKTGP